MLRSNSKILANPCSQSRRRPDKCVLRRSASGGRTAPPDTLRRRPDTERFRLAVEPTQFTPVTVILAANPNSKLKPQL